MAITITSLAYHFVLDACCCEWGTGAGSLEEKAEM